MRVVIAGGGTAGHVNPALALAAALEAEISFIGTAAGAEARLVPAAGLPLDLLTVRGFDRSRPWAFPAVAATALRATAAAGRLLRSHRPDVVVGMGGYVSLPVGLAARWMGIPLVLHEQNIVLGLANRTLRRYATAIGVSFEDTLREAGSRAVFVGNPVSTRIAEFDHAAARRTAIEKYELDADRMTLLVFGGSLGAKTVNAAAEGLRSLWKSRTDLQVLHIAGTAQPMIAGSSTEGLIFRSVAFVDDMTLAYGSADLALCRGGATTVAELTVARVPSIVVPYPYHRDRQQELHGRVLERAGAAVVLADGEATPAKVAELADGLFGDPSSLTAMAAAAGALARPDAARALAGVVSEAAR